jgi:hypothetical protein
VNLKTAAASIGVGEVALSVAAVLIQLEIHFHTEILSSMKKPTRILDPPSFA